MELKEDNQQENSLRVTAISYCALFEDVAKHIKKKINRDINTAKNLSQSLGALARKDTKSAQKHINRVGKNILDNIKEMPEDLVKSIALSREVKNIQSVWKP
ncbi:uncharacterized protein LOC126899692 [Daktulosphaira vitifoliae]|uniref:uncharacterized protein LOC126899692 n=1 Tax=Daktulosphaira vitifoliae TaxID=58002 RepID=UPI0021AA6D6B|nr:uncharacterized protein LOC126899692 [Daktulosphaira vitifoliae]